MPPKNKGQKMDLSTFLNDSSLGGGSWDDEDVDLGTLAIPVNNKFSSGGAGASGHANFSDPAFGGSERRTDHVEYPIPDAPPYRARLNNLPWDATEDSIAEWFINHLQAEDSVLKVVAPKDREDPSKLKGFAFVTFNTREQLEQSLQLSATELYGRRVFVNVAQPEKEGFSRREGRDFGGVEIDWSAPRGGPLPPREERERGPRREEVDVDWSAVRSGPLPPREERERRPRREEVDIDWSAPRGGPLPPREERERRPRREEVEVDWSAARSGPLPPREGREPREQGERKPRREEPSLDWSAVRSGPLPPREPREPREQSERKPRKEEPELNWGEARSGTALPPKRFVRKTHADKEDSWTRGQGLPARNAQSSPQQTKEEPVKKSAKSLFSVLADQDDEDEDTEEEKEKENKQEAKDDVTALEASTAKLSVEESGEDWEVVGKK